MWEFEAIGTHWLLILPESLSEERLSAVQQRVLSRIQEFDRNYSRFLDDSLISKMAQKAGTYELPDDAQQLLDLYKELYDLTDGAYTPLIGQVLSDAGYDSSYSLKPGILQIPPKWEEVLEYSFPTLALKKPALLDFGAAGKGYLVDIVAEILKEQGIESFTINAGGDIRYENTEGATLHVALENPDTAHQGIGIASLTSGSICGSAGNRRAWGNFHHIINPHTLTSPNEIKAVWVTAPSALMADALTTCFFFLQPEELIEKLQGKYSFEYLVVNREGFFAVSEGFPAEVFTAY